MASTTTPSVPSPWNVKTPRPSKNARQRLALSSGTGSHGPAALLVLGVKSMPANVVVFRLALIPRSYHWPALRPARIVGVALSLTSTLFGMNQPGTIQYQHPEYGRHWWMWELARVSYVGGREYLRPTRLSIDFQYPEIKQVNDNGVLTPLVMSQVRTYSYLLHRQSKEQPWEYENRVNRASYTNFFAPIINALVSEVMKQTPTRTGDDQMKAFWDACTEDRDRSFDSEMRDGLTWANVYGVYHAIIDQDPDDTAAGPYMYWVSPLDIIDWSMDDDGCYEWVKQFIYAEAPRKWDEPITPLFQYRVWSKDFIRTYQTSASGGTEKQIDERPNTLKDDEGEGVVPIIPLYSKRDKDASFPNGIPIVGDLAKAANQVFNLQSWLMQILSDQTFGQLVIPSTQIDKIQLGTSRAVGFDPLNGGKPEYISPDPENARVIAEQIMQEIERSRSVIGIGRGRAETSKQQASADALELESEGKKAVLGDIAESAQDFERRVAKVVTMFRTATPAKEPYIQYPREFDIRSLQQAIDEAIALEAIFPPEVMVVIEKALAGRVFSNMPPDEKQALIDSIKVKKIATDGSRLQPGQPDPAQQPPQPFPFGKVA